MAVTIVVLVDGHVDVDINSSSQIPHRLVLQSLLECKHAFLEVRISDFCVMSESIDLYFPLMYSLHCIEFIPLVHNSEWVAVWV